MYERMNACMYVCMYESIDTKIIFWQLQPPATRGRTTTLSYITYNFCPQMPKIK